MKYVKVFIIFFLVVCCIVIGKEVYWARANLIIPLSETELNEMINNEIFLVIIHDEKSDLEQDLPELRSALIATRTKVYSFGLNEASDEIKEYLFSQNMAMSFPVICIFSKGTLGIQYYKSIGALDKAMMMHIFEQYKSHN